MTGRWETERPGEEPKVFGKSQDSGELWIKKDALQP